MPTTEHLQWVKRFFLENDTGLAMVQPGYPEYLYHKASAHTADRVGHISLTVPFLVFALTKSIEP